MCRCYPAPMLSCTLGLLRTDMGGDAGQELRCPQCLHAGVRDVKQGPRCGPSAQPAPRHGRSHVIVWIADMEDCWKCSCSTGERPVFSDEDDISGNRLTAVSKGPISQHRGCCRGAVREPAALQHRLVPVSRKAAGSPQKAEFQAGLRAWLSPALNTIIPMVFPLQVPALPAARL